jgi:hypothetical protein
MGCFIPYWIWARDQPREVPGGVRARLQEVQYSVEVVVQESRSEVGAQRTKKRIKDHIIQYGEYLVSLSVKVYVSQTQCIQR